MTGAMRMLMNSEIGKQTCNHTRPAPRHKSGKEGKMQHVTLEQWREFEEKFPEARQWLHGASVRSELAQLEYEESQQFIMTDWQKKRLTELRFILKGATK